MMKKRICGLTLTALICASAMNVCAFSDMEGDSFSWAKEAVEVMAELEIIKGYEDGTFKPDKSVSKQEALVLMSRICGYSEESSEKYIELAKTEYAETLENYETPYKDEIAYLLYRGIIEEKDTATYVADSVAPLALKRYEAAVLLTKLMGADEEASETEKFTTEFDDMEEIPGIAKGYVEYVCTNEIMNGMGDNKFVPMGDVTRAQMATLLYRVMSNRDFSYVSGTLSSYDADTYSLIMVDEDDEQHNLTVRKTVPVMLDGKATEMAVVSAGSEIRITYSGDSIVFVECISVDFEETIEGIYISSEKYNDTMTIKVKDAVSGITKTYTLASNPSIVREGKSVSVTNLKKEDYVKVDIVGGKAAYITAEDKTSEIVGIIDSIELEPEFALYIDVAGEITKYQVLTAPEVRRNNKSSSLAEIMAGDSVTVTMEYGIISEITATSKITKETGFLQEITISNTPSIVVKVNDELKEYAVLRTVAISKDDAETTMYDLRIGDSVAVTIEGTTVTAIDLTSAIQNSTTTGVVTYINSSYGYIKLEGVNELVFTSKAKVQDKSGKALSIRDIKEGVMLTVFGTQTPGSFEATLLIIVD